MKQRKTSSTTKGKPGILPDSLENTIRQHGILLEHQFEPILSDWVPISNCRADLD